MGSYQTPVEDIDTKVNLWQIVESLFPGCQTEGMQECGFTTPRLEYDIFIKGNPIVYMITLSNGWTWEDQSEKPLSLCRLVLHGQGVPDFVPGRR